MDLFFVSPPLKSTFSIVTQKEKHENNNNKRPVSWTFFYYPKIKPNLCCWLPRKRKLFLCFKQAPPCFVTYVFATSIYFISCTVSRKRSLLHCCVLVFFLKGILPERTSLLFFFFLLCLVVWLSSKKSFLLKYHFIMWITTVAFGVYCVNKMLEPLKYTPIGTMFFFLFAHILVTSAGAILVAPEPHLLRKKWLCALQSQQTVKCMALV